jgi:hypothetical protein
MGDENKYRPIALQGTGFRIVEGGADTSTVLDSFLDNANGEKKSSFTRCLDQVSAAGSGSHRIEIIDPSDNPVALMGMTLSANNLSVSVARTTDSPLALTLARQMVARLRLIAAEEGADAVTISDQYMAPTIKEAAFIEGFSKQADGSLAAAILSGRGDVESLRKRISEVETQTGFCFETLHSRLDDFLHGDLGAALDTEFKARPFELQGVELPAYLVPIKPTWASELLGYPPQILNRDDFLGLSQEHVYYRAPTPSHPRAPARLLWYISKGGPTGGCEIVARSYLIESGTVAAKNAFRRYRRLGVYTWQDVQQASRNEQVGVMRFIGTQQLARPVLLPELRAIENRRSLKIVLQWPVLLRHGVYEEILEVSTQ